MRRMLIAATAMVLASSSAVSQAPVLGGLIPFGIPPITTPGPVTITAGGSGFIPGASQVYANGQPMPTTVISTIGLTFQIPNSLPQAGIPGAVTLYVKNPPNLASNARALVIFLNGGSAANDGTIGFLPLGYTPGQSIQLSMESVWPNQPFALMADTGTPLPICCAPPGGGFIQGVFPGGPTFLNIMDGIGIFGPPNPLVMTQISPVGTSLPGSFLLPPFATQNPPSGVTVSLQAVYLNPASFLGWQLTWPLFPFSL